MADTDFARSVFVNCPFDEAFEPILQALLFCLVRYGLRPRIATERVDSAEARIEKIVGLIRSSRLSIHDLSRCQSKEAGEFYRLNMPFELGIDIGCRLFAGPPYQEKRILILEEQRYRYQAALSDMAGSDIEVHGGDYAEAVRKVRKWLSSFGEFETIGPAKILAEYEDFQEWYWEKQKSAGLDDDDIRDAPASELLRNMEEWVGLGRPRT